MSIIGSIQNKAHAAYEEFRKAPIATTLTAAPAIEMAFRSIGNIAQLMQGGQSKVIQAVKEDLSANLSGTLLFSICTYNPIPASRRSAAALFVIYSLFLDLTNNHNYYTALLIKKSLIYPAMLMVAPLEKFLGIPPHPTWILLSLLGVAYATTKLVNRIIGGDQPDGT